MACKPSCPYWEGHECLIMESKPTLSEFRIWLTENVGEEVESTETLLQIYTHFTLFCMRCSHNPHRGTPSRTVAKVDENLRRLKQSRQELLAHTSTG
ncbi:MAG: hypothetical protein ABIH23_05480 [bacterium]